MRNRITQRHFDVIRHYYPYVKIREYTKPKGDWNYVIYTDDPRYIPVFRTVEIYRSSFRNICSNHVGAVRGCFTSRWSQRPEFYLTSSAVMTGFMLLLIIAISLVVNLILKILLLRIYN